MSTFWRQDMKPGWLGVSSVEKKPECHVVSAQTGWQRGWFQPVPCTCCLFLRCLNQIAQELCWSCKVLPGPFPPQLWGLGAEGAQLGTTVSLAGQCHCSFWHHFMIPIWAQLNLNCKVTRCYGTAQKSGCITELRGCGLTGILWVWVLWGGCLWP